MLLFLYFSEIRHWLFDALFTNASYFMKLDSGCLKTSSPRRLSYFSETRLWLYENLFTTSPLLLEINKLWYEEYKDRRPFCLDQLVTDSTPTLPELREIVAKMCTEFRTCVLLDG